MNQPIFKPNTNKTKKTDDIEEEQWIWFFFLAKSFMWMWSKNNLFFGRTIFQIIFSFSFILMRGLLLRNRCCARCEVIYFRRGEKIQLLFNIVRCYFFIFFFASIEWSWVYKFVCCMDSITLTVCFFYRQWMSTKQ